MVLPGAELGILRGGVQGPRKGKTVGISVYTDKQKTSGGGGCLNP